MTGETGSDRHIASQLADLSERMVGHEDASLVAEAASRLMHTRALGPALDRVLEAVEAMPKERINRAMEPIGPRGPMGYRDVVLTLLHALRAEQTADAGGERGGGS